MNSLVLHCASPAAHNIATSKVAVIFNMFNGHPKRGNKAPFCSRNAFNSDFDYSTRLKSVYLETRPSLFEEYYHIILALISVNIFGTIGKMYYFQSSSHILRADNSGDRSSCLSQREHH